MFDARARRRIPRMKNEKNTSTQPVRIDPYRVRIPKISVAGMTTDGMIYANEKLFAAIQRDETLDQVINVAMLPGLVGNSIAMPDAHQGYGFCIGGVAASNTETGIVSAGGVGFDINCGVRLLATPFDHQEIKSTIRELIDRLFNTIPTGTGRSGKIHLSYPELDSVLSHGMQWAVKNGYGQESDLDLVEENGRMQNANPAKVSDRAKQRGRDQLGTLGSGNHFLEVQIVSEVYDAEAAQAFGLHEQQIVVLIHTGSRGLGHQVCTDALQSMDAAMKKYGIVVKDRQLACVPIASREGTDYLQAMAAAANFAFANRQAITHWTREVFAQVLGNGNLSIVYDVCHNMAKFETHRYQGQNLNVLVHRKGATRAFPQQHSALPARYLAIGQPVLIPGSMGTCSYVLVGKELAMDETFGSCCHGAGRSMSRNKAKQETSAAKVLEELTASGIIARAQTNDGLTEENPHAYKDVSEVVEVVHRSGIAGKVVKLKPIGVIKG